MMLIGYNQNGFATPKPCYRTRWVPIAMALLMLIGATPAFTQPLRPIDTPPMSPSQSDISNATPTPQSLDLSSYFRLESAPPVVVGKDFQIVAGISWEGLAEWISLDFPEVNWPVGIKNREVSTRVKSSVAPDTHQNVSTKEFVFLLQATQSGEISFPELTIPVVFPDGSTTSITSPPLKLTVDPQPVTWRDRLADIKTTTWGIIGGVAGLVILSLLVTYTKTRRTSSESGPTLVEQYQNEAESLLQQAQALRNAGETRKYYEVLETALLQAAGWLKGESASRSEVLRWGRDNKLPAWEDLEGILSELSDWRFRPDQPRTEVLKQLERRSKEVINQMLQSIPEESQK